MSSGKHHKRTDHNAGLVKGLALAGYRDEEIAKSIGVGEATVKKFYSTELHAARINANAAVVATLYRAATNGNITAAIFWCKTRLGWREKTEIEHSGEFTTTVNIVVKKPAKPEKVQR